MAKVSGMTVVAAMAAWGAMTGGPAAGWSGGPTTAAAAAGFAAASGTTAGVPVAGGSARGLAAVAVTPDPAEHAVRQRVSRVKSYMRSLATGLETYYVDNATYPIAVVEGSIRKPGPGEARVPSFRPGANPSSLTTPIAYMPSYFDDPFGRERQTFGYWSATEANGVTTGWILFSPGPDGKFDLDWTKYDPTVPQPSPEIIPYFYDPTNGNWSPGDIVRVKQ